MMNWTALFPSTGMFPIWDQQNLSQSNQDKKEERRKRNREHAKKTRQRKKSQFEALTDQVLLLKKENEQLRKIVSEEIPDHAQSIIKECCKRHPLVADGRKKDLSGSDFALIENLTMGRHSFVLTDPHLPDNPIVYASEAFYQLTGFTREETLGRNCRFLQGPETEHKAVEKIRTCIQQGIDASVTLLNYKKDGTPFENRFFLAALRDKDNRIVNYVGVQCDNRDQDQEHKEIDESISKAASQLSLDPLTLHDDGHEAEQNAKRQRTFQVAGEARYPHGTTTTQEPSLPLVVPSTPAAANFRINDSDEQDFDRIDWSILAQALEADYKEGSLLDQVGDYPFVYQSPVLSPDQSPILSAARAPTQVWDEESPVLSASQAPVWDESSQYPEQQAESYLEHFRSCPGLFVTKTCRSELVESLLSSHGDVTDNRFLKALDVLSSIYSSSCQGSLPYISTPVGSWRSISRPSYGGCLGRNLQGDFCYPLGKMSFNMFKPGNLTCSVQHTLNKITLSCEMDGAPKAAPWSLRRELASWDPNNPDKQGIPPCATMLASYDIAVALTIEPTLCTTPSGQEIPFPCRRLRGLQVVHGYMLPDPDVPNRLTVWFTGGELSPAPPPHDGSQEETSEYGSLEEWKELFGGEHKRTWKESFSVIGAKLFLGAELQDSMDSNGTMSYTLHRPYGGHGKAYVDVLYCDEVLLLTKGCHGSLHVTVKVDFLESVAPISYSASRNDTLGMMQE